MFASPAYASAGAAPDGAAGFFVSIAPLVLIFIIFYFLLIRPQQRRMKQHQSMIAAVKKNDTAVTSGGGIGKDTCGDEKEEELGKAAGERVKGVEAKDRRGRAFGGKTAKE